MLNGSEAPRRVLVVTRKYWPLVDESTLRLMHTIEAWRSRGIHATVVTARWHPQWPERAMLRDTPVFRLLPAPRTNWNEGQFQRNVATWIQGRVDAFDAIYVDRSDGLLATICQRGRGWNLPVMARFSLESPPAELARSQWFSPSAAADALRHCDRVIVASPFAQRVLQTHGIAADRIAWIPDAVSGRAQRTVAARQSALAALTAVSSGFAVPAHTDLIVHFGSAEPKGLTSAALAVCDLLDAGRLVRMWIFGAGSATETVYQSVQSRGWHREILLFEPFDDLEELISVADLAIVSHPESALQFSAPLIVASELPMAMASTVESMHWLPETHLMKWYDNRESLHERLRDWIVHRQQWLAEATALRAHAMNHLAIDRHRDLWRTAVVSDQREARR